MDYTESLAAAAKSAGKVVVLTAWSAPTKPKEFDDRATAAAGRQAEHRALGRVKTTGEAFTDEAGRITFEFRVAGQVNRDVHPEGVYLSKKGEPCVDIVVSAPTEYGYTTACPNAGKLGSACVKRRPFHCHRTINLTRLVSWLVAGEEQANRQQGC